MKKVTSILVLVFLTIGGVVFADSVNLAWDESPSSDVAGYNLYRSTAPDGPFSKLNDALIEQTSTVDSTVVDGSTYFYACTAVNSSGMESDYSNILQVEVRKRCLGDADLDGQRSITDSVLILNHITGNITLKEDAMKAADFDENNDLNILDAVQVMNAIVGNIVAEPCN